MSASTRWVLGIASALPAVALAGALALRDAVASEASTPEGAVIAGALAVMVAGLGGVLALVWVAGGLDRPLPWRVAWVVALTAWGVAAAPVFWWLHVRQPAESPASGGASPRRAS